MAQSFPTTADLRVAARKRLPHFAFEFSDGGAGGADSNIKRNWASLDGVELIPRYGVVGFPPTCETVLLGRSYAAPIGIAPMGIPSLAFPGADQAIAEAAQSARVPYVLGLLAGITIEHAAKLAPDVLWFQLYRCYRDNHRIGMDLLHRAEASGAHALMLTMDTPVRTVRPREVKSGITGSFGLTLKLMLATLLSPRWLYALRIHGMPRFANLERYLGVGADMEKMVRFAAEETGGAFSWEEVARYRDKWKRRLVLKGLLHPEDVEKAVSLGVDGVVVSNHGGRQIEALPASIDVLPALVEQANARTSIMLDSGIRSGVDAARAIALGADGVLAGKSVLWSLGALGTRGPAHVVDTFISELSATLGQLGCAQVQELRTVGVRHPTAYGTQHFMR